MRQSTVGQIKVHVVIIYSVPASINNNRSFAMHYHVCVMSGNVVVFIVYFSKEENKTDFFLMFIIP